MNRIEIQNMSASDYRYDEAIKILRTNIRFSGSSIKTILVTSTSPGEGKSTISWDLSMSFAQTGNRTLYIDADLRKSVFIERFGIESKVKGLSELLSGQISIEECIYSTSVENLDMVFSGPFTPNPTELFEDRICADFFRFIKQEQGYDTIVVDSAPIGNVIDAAVLAKYADGVAVIVESEETSRKLLKKVSQQLERTGTKILGFILNKVKMNKGSYYNSYYYGSKKRYGEKMEKYYR